MIMTMTAKKVTTKPHETRGRMGIKLSRRKTSITYAAVLV